MLKYGFLGEKYTKVNSIRFLDLQMNDPTHLHTIEYLCECGEKSGPQGETDGFCEIY